MFHAGQELPIPTLFQAKLYVRINAIKSRHHVHQKTFVTMKKHKETRGVVSRWTDHSRRFASWRILGQSTPLASPEENASKVSSRSVHQPTISIKKMNHKQQFH
mmetsp:Transcript_25956/g.54147  ORF Transcript_25956/g.54147 Transcript_25956/m.54147 type:complete len:104 (+) Transcript_25956:595-906(+)